MNEKKKKVIILIYYLKFHGLVSMRVLEETHEITVFFFFLEEIQEGFNSDLVCLN